MSDWLRDVEQAGYSYSVQYSGPDEERNPLLGYRETGIKYAKIFWILFLTILFCTGLVIGCYLIFEEDTENTATTRYTLISRSGWRALPPSPQLTLPLYPFPKVHHVSIRQTDTDTCDSHPTCSKIVRDIQTKHMKEMNMTDIGYGFLVAGDGAMYEGQGWRIGVQDGTEMGIVVAFVGTFDDAAPSPIQTDELKSFFHHSLKRGRLDPCFTISLYKERPQDGGGQLVHIYNKLMAENNRRKAQIISCHNNNTK